MVERKRSTSAKQPRAITMQQIVDQARREAGRRANDSLLVFILAKEICNELITRELGRQGLLSRRDMEAQLSICHTGGERTHQWLTRQLEALDRGDRGDTR